MNSKALKAKVKLIGVPKVSKASGVQRTTLYEWLKSPTQNLGLSRHEAVEKAVAELEREGSDGIGVVDEEYLEVPFYDIKASAGSGALVADTSVPVTHEKFRLSFLQSLVDGAFDKVSLITVTGDSMEATLRPGDWILVDRSVTRWVGDGIYVLQIDGVLQVKRLQRDDDGSLLIRSDNPAYQTIKPKKGLPFEVIGRVVWFARAMR